MAVDTAEKTRALVESVALNPLDPKDLLHTFGLIGVWVILFAETGLLVGFFFPGDSLLFLAGVAASPVADAIFGDGTRLSLAGLLIGAPICAIVGAQLGHWLGARYGRRMFERPNSRLFKREYVEKAEYYFQKFGPAKAVVLARFIPIVRTFLNPVAGTLGMPARQFLLWNVVGAVLWVDGILLIGYLLAEQIYDAIGDKIDQYILPVVALIIADLGAADLLRDPPRPAGPQARRGGRGGRGGQRRRRGGGGPRGVRPRRSTSTAASARSTARTADGGTTTTAGPLVRGSAIGHVEPGLRWCGPGTSRCHPPMAPPLARHRTPSRTRDGVQCLRQRAFLVARLRGGVSRSAIVAIATAPAGSTPRHRASPAPASRPR